MKQNKINSFFKIKKSCTIHPTDDTNNNDTASESGSDTETKITEKKAPKPQFVMYFDGCSKGNPGEAGAGAVIYKNGEEIWSNAVFVGDKETNNVAEYTGLLIGLNQAVTLGIKELHVKGDSLLVIKQMRGEYKVSSESIKTQYKLAKTITKKIPKIEFKHVYREFNKRADELSNLGLLKNPKYVVY